MSRKFCDKLGIRGDAVSASLMLNQFDKYPKIQGFVGVRVWEGEVGSKLVDEIDLGENLIVTSARRVVSRLIAGAVQDSTATDPTITVAGGPVIITNVSDLYITKMKWGTGGHQPLDPSQPIPPSSTDEDLINIIADPTFKSVVVDYPEINEVRFTASLGLNEANGNTLSEVGLFTNNHDFLFARKTFGILTKSADFSFEFRYTVII